MRPSPSDPTALRSQALLPALLLALATCSPMRPLPVLGQEDPPPALPAAPNVESAHLAALGRQLLGRLAVLGASASDGFGLPTELEGADRSLADFLRAAIRSESGFVPEILDVADHNLFLAPIGRATRQVEQAMAFEPRTVIAIDFLFWFVYGDLPEQDRPALLERGLGLLDRLLASNGATLVISDIALMESASLLMLPSSMRAGPDAVEAANQRIAAWAAERPDVVLLPLAGFVAAVLEDERVEGPGWLMEDEEALGLLQPDGLHPSVLGTAALLEMALDGLIRAAAQHRLPLGYSSWAELSAAEQDPELWRRALDSLCVLDPRVLAERVRESARAPASDSAAPNEPEPR